MPFFIVEKNIFEMETECIVISADVSLKNKGGMSTELYNTVENSKGLAKECDKIGFCGSCECVTTNSYGLKSKYIIHSVGAIFSDSGKRAEEYIKLCYKNVIYMARKKMFKSIAIPFIATGKKGYPKDMVLRCATEVVEKYLSKYDMDIYFAVKNRSSLIPEINLIDNINKYIENNLNKEKDKTDKFEDKVSFGEILKITLKEYRVKEKILYNKSNMEKTVIKHFINNTKEPTKEAVLAIAVALKMNLNDIKSFVKKSGFEFSKNNKQDIIISYFVQNNEYNIYKINEMLFYYKENQIGFIQ